jgi:hypothetical protein
MPGAVVSSPVPISASAAGSGTVKAMQVYVDGSLQYEKNAASISTNVAMSAGAHQVAVEMSDESGAVKKNEFKVTVATPRITISSPAPNYTGYSPITLWATTVDPNLVYAVQAYVDNTLAYQYTGTGIDANALNLTAGNHNVVVQAWDVAGGIYKKNLAVNITPIVVTVSTPAPNATVTSPVQIKASVPGNAPVIAIQIYDNNVLAYTADALSLNTSLSLSAGSHSLVAKAWDTGGGTWTTALNITVKQ